MNDSGSTPDRILIQAAKLFAEKGFDRASVRTITHRAGANLGAVTYHYGSKQRLYDAVLERFSGAMADRVAAAAATTGTAKERLAAITHAMFGFFAEYPEVPRVMLRELVRGGAPPAAVRPRVRRNLDAITMVIRDGQSAGEFRPIEPTLAAFSLMSQTMWFAVVGPAIGPIVGSPLDRTDAPAIVERHIVDLVTRGLAPDRAPA